VDSAQRQAKHAAEGKAGHSGRLRAPHAGVGVHLHGAGRSERQRRPVLISDAAGMAGPVWGGLAGNVGMHLSGMQRGGSTLAMQAGRGAWGAHACWHKWGA